MVDNGHSRPRDEIWRQCVFLSNNQARVTTPRVTCHERGASPGLPSEAGANYRAQDPHDAAQSMLFMAIP